MSKLPSNCICMYDLMKVSTVHPFLSCLEKGFTFDVCFSLELCATSYTSPYLLSFLTWIWYPPLCNAVSIFSGLSICHFLHVHQIWRCWLLFTFNCMQYFIKHFQSIWGLSSVIARSQLGASPGEIRVIKHFPGCITERIYFIRELWSCLCA